MRTRSDPNHSNFVLPSSELARQKTASSATYSTCLSPFHLCPFVCPALHWPCCPPFHKTFKLDKEPMWPWEGDLLVAALQSARLNVPQLRDCRSSQKHRIEVGNRQVGGSWFSYSSKCRKAAKSLNLDHWDAATVVTSRIWRNYH